MSTDNAETTIAKELLDLSRWLGAPERECVILGEGNTSARLDDESFLLKASGHQLDRLDASGLVRMDFGRTRALLEDQTLTDENLGAALIAARSNPDDDRRPSVEATLHGMCLMLPGIHFVGHTHPTAINALTCSVAYPDCLRGRLFPDEIVVCGDESLLVPYVDPGAPLTRTVKAALDDFLAKHGAPPKTIYLQSHGFVALGATAGEVKAITQMAVKAARIRVGAIAAGGLQMLPGSVVERIDNRPDEDYRRRQLDLGVKDSGVGEK